MSPQHCLRTIFFYELVLSPVFFSCSYFLCKKMQGKNESEASAAMLVVAVVIIGIIVIILNPFFVSGC